MSKLHSCWACFDPYGCSIVNCRWPKIGGFCTEDCRWAWDGAGMLELLEKYR